MPFHIHRLIRRGIRRAQSSAAAGGVAFFIVAVVGGAWWTLWQIQSAVEEAVQRNLATMIATTRESARHWATRQQAVAVAIAGNRGLVALMERAVRQPLEKASLDSTAVRQLLHPLIRPHAFRGYWVLGANRTTLASSAPPLPHNLPLLNPDALDRALDGLPTLSPLKDDSPYWPHLVSLVPILGPRGHTLGVLALALPAEREFARLAGRSQLRALGQLTFYDSQGRVLGTTPGSEGDLWQSEERFRRLGATRLSGADLAGYRNGMGLAVVGAWEWDDQMNLGLAAESEIRVVYHVVHTSRQTLVVAVAVTLMLFLAVLYAMQRTRRQAVALSALQRRLAAVLESTTDPVCFADAAGRPIYLNQSGRSLLGGPDDRGRSASEPPPHWAQVLLHERALQAAASEGAWTGDSTILTADGREVTLSHVVLCHRREDGEIEFYSTVARDVSESRQLSRRLVEEKERAEVTLGSIGDAVVRTDAEGRIEYLNPVAEELLGCPASELVGRPIQAVVAIVHETTRDPIENPITTALRERRVIGRSNLSLLVRPDGREVAIDDSAAPITSPDGLVLGAVLVFHDVSRARTLARQLAHQASHDFLTGLVNRHEFERRVQRAINRAKQDHDSHAVCYLDLDQFKVVNDTCGHVAGDELLRQLAGILSKRMRRRDTLARLGGDEFGVLLEHCPPGQASRVAHELLEAIQEFRFVWEGKPFALGVSVGVVVINAESEGLGRILRDADAACYAAKERGRNRVHFYQPGDAVITERQGEMQWVSRITSALEEGRFRLYGQAIVPLVPRQGERLRCEVLLRLVERDGTLVSPGAFIPAAERYGLMGAVDRWVVREVLAMYARLRGNGRPAIVSINLSGASLGDPAMLDLVREELTRYDLPPDALCFEITETAAIANLGQATEFIRELKALGCWFALDDFGSGMSSFAYLQTLPVDALKIAGSFLRHIENEPVAYALVEAIHRVGHVMQLVTVAEGVESMETLHTLRQIGVDYAQGYAVSQPGPLEELFLSRSLPLTRAAAIPSPIAPPAAHRSRPAIA